MIAQYPYVPKPRPRSTGDLPYFAHLKLAYLKGWDAIVENSSDFFVALVLFAVTIGLNTVLLPLTPLLIWWSRRRYRASLSTQYPNVT